MMLLAATGSSPHRGAAHRIPSAFRAGERCSRQTMRSPGEAIRQRHLTLDSGRTRPDSRTGRQCRRPNPDQAITATIATTTRPVATNPYIRRSKASRKPTPTTPATTNASCGSPMSAAQNHRLVSSRVSASQRTGRLPAVPMPRPRRPESRWHRRGGWQVRGWLR